MSVTVVNAFELGQGAAPANGLTDEMVLPVGVPSAAGTLEPGAATLLALKDYIGAEASIDGTIATVPAAGLVSSDGTVLTAVDVVGASYADGTLTIPSVPAVPPAAALLGSAAGVLAAVAIDSTVTLSAGTLSVPSAATAATALSTGQAAEVAAGAAQSAVGSLASTVSGQGTTLTSLTGSVSALNTEVTAATSSAGIASALATSALGTATTALSTAGTLAATVSSHGTSLTSLGGTIATLSTGVASNTSSLSTLGTAQASTASSLATLTTTLTGTQSATFALAAPTSAAGTPTYRQLTQADIAGLTSSAAPTFGGINTSGGATIGSSTHANTYAAINGAAGSSRGLSFQSGGTVRAILGLTNAAETGANVGSDPYFAFFADNGTQAFTPINWKRSTGLQTINNGLVVKNGQTVDALTITGGARDVWLDYYSPVGDGVTDDLPAFTRAFNDIGGLGGVLHVRRGQYRCSKLSPPSNCTIVGETGVPGHNQPAANGDYSQQGAVIFLDNAAPVATTTSADAPIGSSTITLTSVAGFAVNTPIFATNLPRPSVITAINTTTNVVTFSPSLTNADMPAGTTVTGVSVGGYLPGGCRLRNLVFMPTGMNTVVSNTQAVRNDLALWANRGAAFLTTGGDGTIEDCLFLGFNWWCIVQLASRHRFMRVCYDTWSGLLLGSGIDFCYLSDCHGFYYYTEAAQAATADPTLPGRGGIAIEVQSQLDIKILRCFDFGHAVGVRLSGCQDMSCVECFMDNLLSQNVAGTVASIGFHITGGSEGCSLVGCQTDSQNQGFVVDAVPSATHRPNLLMHCKDIDSVAAAYSLLGGVCVLNSCYSKVGSVGVTGTPVLMGGSLLAASITDFSATSSNVGTSNAYSLAAPLPGGLKKRGGYVYNYIDNLGELDGTDYLNVMAFGAKGDGVTDDTAAFMAAITAQNAAPNLVPLYVPAARYLVALSITNQHIWMIGEGVLLWQQGKSALIVNRTPGPAIAVSALTQTQIGSVTGNAFVDDAQTIWTLAVASVAGITQGQLYTLSSQDYYPWSPQASGNAGTAAPTSSQVYQTQVIRVQGIGVPVRSATSGLVEDATVVGATSGATGLVRSVSFPTPGTGYAIFDAITGAFQPNENLTVGGTSVGVCSGPAVLFSADRIYDIYTSSPTIQLFDTKTFILDGLSLDIPVGANPDLLVGSAQRQPGLMLQGVYEPRIVNFTVRNGWTRAIQLCTAFMGDVEVKIEQLPDDANLSEGAYGYGVELGGSTDGTRVRVIGGNCRHAFTTNVYWGGYQYMPLYQRGNPKHFLVYDSVVRDCFNAAFDTHWGCYFGTFSNCLAYGPTHLNRNVSGSIGFQNRGFGTRYTACRVIDAVWGFNTIADNLPSGFLQSVTYDACEAIDFQENGFLCGVASAGGNNKVEYLNCRARGDGRAANAPYNQTGFNVATAVYAEFYGCKVDRWNGSAFQFGGSGGRIRLVDTYIDAYANPNITSAIRFNGAPAELFIQNLRGIYSLSYGGPTGFIRVAFAGVLTLGLGGSITWLNTARGALLDMQSTGTLAATWRDLAYSIANPKLQYQVGRYYAPSVSSQAQTPTVGSLTALPFMISEDAVTLTALALGGASAGAGGSTTRLGLYADAAGVPGALLLDAGTVSTDAIGTEATAAQTLALTRGIYWLASQPAIAGTTAPTVYCSTGGTALAGQLGGASALTALGQSMPLGIVASGYSTVGALPATFPTPVIATSGVVPVVTAQISPNLA